ncbi:hypothetical protein CHUAL_013161 [Chamberlinius hualienensis]
MNVQRHTSLLNRAMPIPERKLNKTELRDDSRSVTSDYEVLRRSPSVAASTSPSSTNTNSKSTYVPYTYRSLPSTPVPIYSEVSLSKDDDVLLKHNQALQRQQQPFQRNGNRSSFSSIRSDSAVQRKAVSFGRAVKYDYTSNGTAARIPAVTKVPQRSTSISPPNSDYKYNSSSSNSSIYGVPAIVKSSLLPKSIINPATTTRTAASNQNGHNSDYGYASSINGSSPIPRTNQSGTLPENVYVTRAEVHPKPRSSTDLKPISSGRTSRQASDDEVFYKGEFFVNQLFYLEYLVLVFSCLILAE